MEMKKIAGWLMFGTLLLYLVSVALPGLVFIPALMSWLVVIVLWACLGRSAKRQALVLFGSGVLALSYAFGQGVFLGWREVLAVNLPVIAMFVAVSFLTLTSPGIEKQPLSSGNRAAAQTAVGTHLLGGVINLSALFVIGDRLMANGGMKNVQLITLARSFCAAAWWSPFFVATGVALTYAPGMQWKETLVPGIIMSCIAISYTLIEVTVFRKSEFHGYPIRPESLKIPLFLAASVLLAHHFRPDFGILLLISLISPAGAVIFMKERPRGRILHQFIENRLLSTSSQFALFLSAGVFSTGLRSIIYANPELFSFHTTVFTPLLFAGVLGAMIVVGVLGVHPVVSIAIVSPLLLPLNPDPSQLAFMFLTSWAVSTSSSPLSGVGLALVGRYQARPVAIIRDNFHYAIAMWAIASVMNLLFFG
jgi:hypothetical protein